MKKIILFIPYYGKLPNYFMTWAKSIEHLDGFVDFIIVTDIDVKGMRIPANMKIIKMSFVELQEHARKKKFVPPTHPYKLCDYKPVYGKIFEEYITDDYEFWGHCDIDTVFGDVKGFLEKIGYRQYDRIGGKGHFTIYRNNEQTKSLFRYELKNDNHPYNHFNYVVKTTYPCHFDEAGMNLICKELNLKFYEHPLEFNTKEKSKHIHTIDNKNSYELLTWENGHTYRYCLTEGDIVSKEEQMYIHYQYQKNMPQLGNIGNSFFISFDGFRPFCQDSIIGLLKEYGRLDNDEESQKEESRYKQKLRQQRRERFIREFKAHGIRSIYSVIVRIPSLFVAAFKYKNF